MNFSRRSSFCAARDRFGLLASVSLPSASGSAVEVARSLLDLGRPRELGLEVAGVPAPFPPADVVSAGSLSSAVPSPPGGSCFAGL